MSLQMLKCCVFIWENCLLLLPNVICWLQGWWEFSCRLLSAWYTHEEVIFHPSLSCKTMFDITEQQYTVRSHTHCWEQRLNECEYAAHSPLNNKINNKKDKHLIIAMWIYWPAIRQSSHITFIYIALYTSGQLIYRTIFGIFNYRHGPKSFLFRDVSKVYFYFNIDGTFILTALKMSASEPKSL